MTYDETVRYIRETAAFGSRLGLDNIRTLMSLLGNPQEKLKVIHIAGTNGKGSVAAYMLSVLEASGYRTGFYTSPDLTRLSERIRIDHEEISESDMAYYATKVRETVEYITAHELGRPSEFELVLAMAFCYFLDRAVDVVILEVGLGGRLDATNVINTSLISIITRISFDHMQFLGDTLPLIAGEKAAIIKPGGRAICYPAKRDVMAVFEEECLKKGAELNIAKLPTDKTASLQDGQSFTLNGEKYRTKMAGLYETDNAALSIQALKLLKKDLPLITDGSIRQGIESAGWPGRFEILTEKPYIIADGAHNEDGARALAESLRRYFGDARLTLCMGILKDKQYKEMLSHLLPLAGRVIVCEVPSTRTLTAGELKEVIKDMSPDTDIISADSMEDACIAIKKLRHEAAATVICGSLYLVGPMREAVLKS